VLGSLPRRRRRFAIGLTVVLLGLSPAPGALALAAGSPAVAAEAAPMALAAARAEVEGLLAEQAAAWNRGDLVAFTSVYADDATFVSPSGLQHGREAVLARYRQKYPDRRAMGRLGLEVTEARPLGLAAQDSGCGGGPAGPAKAARLAATTPAAPVAPAASATVDSLSVVARWRLSFPDDPGKQVAEGWTLLVLQRLAGRWRILQDVSL
jgi:ketosteroid isomerase-like protein